MTQVKKISIGLQGGGSYGAYGWGVLDRLLDDERIVLDGIAACSAGAINAAALADGYADGGGRQGARRSLAKFWNALGQTASMSPMRPTPVDYLMGGGSIQTSPGYLLLQLATATLSPYQLSPMSITPLATLLGSLIDFGRVRSCDTLRLFVSATNVRTGKGRNFRREELDVQKILASACLPQVFAPVQVDGEHYWDGSFVGNPPLSPLVDHAQARDILLIQNNPVARRDLPASMADVHSRTNEIAFNIALIRELSAIQNLATVLDEEYAGHVHHGAVRLHLISAGDALREMNLSSKFNMDWGFIKHLHDLGQADAHHWLETCFDQVGVRSTLDLEQVYASAPLEGGALAEQTGQ